METQCSSSNKYVIVLACGRGKRMNMDIPKQFLILINEPIVMTTIRNIYKIDNSYKIILVLNEEDKDYWDSLVNKYSFNIPCTIVFGGKQRYYSVKNALDSIVDDDNALVAVHDGVRPIVSSRIFENCFSRAERKGNAVCCTGLNESVKYLNDDFSYSTLDRSKIRIIQTPQCFKLGILKKAYDEGYHEEFTDDSAYVENIGEKITLIKGLSSNIKITYPADLIMAKVLINILEKARNTSKKKTTQDND
jgi:2-C-methyl-D-erythritol 4-phosphate cytidylyltransferase